MDCSDFDWLIPCIHSPTVYTKVTVCNSGGPQLKKQGIQPWPFPTAPCFEPHRNAISPVFRATAPCSESSECSLQFSLRSTMCTTLLWEVTSSSDFDGFRGNCLQLSLREELIAQPNSLQTLMVREKMGMASNFQDSQLVICCTCYGFWDVINEWKQARTGAVSQRSQISASNLVST